MLTTQQRKEIFIGATNHLLLDVQYGNLGSEKMYTEHAMYAMILCTVHSMSWTCGNYAMI